jgi:hypothetical protein
LIDYERLLLDHLLFHHLGRRLKVNKAEQLCESTCQGHHVISDLHFVISNNIVHFFYDIVAKCDEGISDERNFILHSITYALDEMLLLKYFASVVAYFLHTWLAFETS